MHPFTHSLNQAKALTLQGRLIEATRLIQTGLGVEHPPFPDPAPSTADSEKEDSQKEADSSTPTQPATLRSPSWRAQKAEAEDVKFREPTDSEPKAQPASFALHTFRAGAHTYNYRLFIPSGTRAESSLPLLVMLHGCKQNADDFARGTAMNVIAEREKFIVVYPEQIRKSNGMGCWNWFKPQHQQRAQGEPAMIAALVIKLVADHAADASRVYIAGLSAGGAMAALVGQLYPEIFAAVGVHSGLAPGAAHDDGSAFSAMRKGPGNAVKRPIALPIIVFQGSGDKTVAPVNAQTIVKVELDALAARGIVLQRTTEEVKRGAGRKATRESWMDPDGTCRVENWNVAAAPHAWAGGNITGSFTDPQGPSASEAMFQFFRLHSK